MPDLRSSTNVDLRDSALYFNRELSWLSFNERVLEEAMDQRMPLLERLKFLAIFSNNLDEFMMIRYAGLKDQTEAGVTARTPDGRTPAEQLQAIAERLHPTVARHRQVLREDVLPALAREGVVLVPYRELSESDRERVEHFFQRELFPVLTPLAIDAGHPFPRLPNLSYSLLLELLDDEYDEPRLGVVQVPGVLPRFLRLPGDDYRFILLEEILQAKVEKLYPGLRLKRAYGFRLTRDADLEIAEDEAEDLLAVIEDEVRKRRWGDAVRLEVVAEMPDSWREFLRRNLRLSPDDVYEIHGFLNVVDFFELANLDIPELHFPAAMTRLPTEYRGESDIFNVIRHNDVLLHHPFHAFDSVLALIEQAASDPDVLAIKQTLYRVGRKSPIVDALARAAGNGKLVTALVELKARFDEENNIVWARELERSGVHVVYGITGLKTHCKALMVVRREGDEIRRYLHLSTGNYNRVTSTIYTDMALLTCDPALAADTSDLFNYLTGYSRQNDWRKMWVAPINLRQKVVEAIRREADHAAAGHVGRIVVKMNSLVDQDVIIELYKASSAGVQIDLIIRGICCLRPDVSGVSENIRVRSIVGRFLEHSRIMYFHNGGRDEVYLGSADWMPRNLDRRVETVFPVESEPLRQKIMQVLDLLLHDNEKARELQPDGFYRRVEQAGEELALNAQHQLLELSRLRLSEAEMVELTRP